MNAESTSALKEIREKLPWGEPGRIVNSFVFPTHPDTMAAAIRKAVPPYDRPISRFLHGRKAFYLALGYVRRKENGYFDTGDILNVSMQPCTVHAEEMKFAVRAVRLSTINSWRVTGSVFGFVDMSRKSPYAQWTYYDPNPCSCCSPWRQSSSAVTC